MMILVREKSLFIATINHEWYNEALLLSKDKNYDKTFVYLEDEEGPKSFQLLILRHKHWLKLFYPQLGEPSQQCKVKILNNYYKI